VSKQLAQWNSGLSRDSNPGPRARIPSALTTTLLIKSIKQSLTPEAMKTLVYAFISTRIDSIRSNSVFTGISGQLLQRLQAIQNAAARLITGARRSQHVTPILRQLHWLPIRQRILFKTAVLVY